MDEPKMQGRTDLIVSLEDNSSHGRRGHVGWMVVLLTDGGMGELLAVSYVDDLRNQVSNAGSSKRTLCLNASQQNQFG